MKSSANASNRKQTPLTTSRITQQPAGGSAGVLRPSGTTVPSSASGTAAAAGGVADGVSIADAEDRLLLHETKKAIDHLKSVTGIIIIIIIILFLFCADACSLSFCARIIIHIQIQCGVGNLLRYYSIALQQYNPSLIFSLSLKIYMVDYFSRHHTYCMHNSQE